MNNIPIPI